VKGNKEIMLNAASLITAELVVPAKAGIQACPCENREPEFKEDGFPRIKHGAGLVKPGMINLSRLISPCVVVVLILILISIGITLTNPVPASGQSKEKRVLIQDSKKDPFLLPPGVRLLSKIDTASGTREISSKTGSKPSDILSSSLTVKAILISDQVRLALIDHNIVSVGDSIHDEKVLEIKANRVILGKGDQKRTLLLSQSPVQLTVEERNAPTPNLPNKGKERERGKGE